MRIRASCWFTCVLTAFAAGGASRGDTTLRTADGLAVSFSDSDGSVTAVRVHDQPVPLLVGQLGGLAVRIGTSLPPAGVCAYDFNAPGGGWTAARNADWDAAGPYVEWLPAGGIGDSGHLRLGDGVTLGAGMAMAAPVPVAGGSVVRIRWQARSATADTAQILCVRVYDANGSDITAATPAPVGWGYTATSQAHAVWGLRSAAADVWEAFEQRYYVAPQAAALRVSLRHWNGGDHVVHLDDLDVDVVAGIAWSARVDVSGPVVPIPGGIRQETSIPGQDLRVTADVLAGAHALQVDVSLQDLSGDVADRPLQLEWSLPVDAAGWQWWDDLDTAREITGAGGVQNSFALAGHAVSSYPFACVTNGATGLALAVPMDEPLAQRCAWEPVGGLKSVWDLALSPRTVKLGAGRAAVSLCVYSHDGEWGFRAAARAYHALFPEYFVKRTRREGAWMYPVPPSQIPDPADFGFAFLETWPLPAADLDVCAQHDIGVFYYVEPWIAWQPWGTSPDKPPYDERLARMESWAASPAVLATWESDGGVDDTGHLRLGDGYTTGAGMATADAFAVAGGETLAISWQARVADVAATQILCVRIYDAGGLDITVATPAPPGWFWSGTSQAHTIAGLANTQTGVWQPFSASYGLVPAASAVRLSLRYWNGGDGFVHIDELNAVGILSGATVLALPLDANDGAWVSAQHADWDGEGDVLWLRTPRQEAAQAVLTGSPLDAEGRFLIDFNAYFWHEWAPDTWNQAWPLVPDPDLPPPNTFELYRQDWILAYLDEIDGVYIDSVTAGGAVGGWENRRPDHLALSDTPLTFSWLDGGAAQLAPQAHAEFLEPIAAEVRGTGRLMMLNLFSEAMRFHAHHADVMGSEVFELVDSDARSRLRRTLAGPRIVSNLLQWGWDQPEYATYEQMETYIRGQLFWGFYPAVSSAGGMLSGGTPDRYFHHPELYERDRPLFRTYMPVIRMLSAAGWEPVTYAGAMPAGEVERFGDFARGPVYLTVRGVDGGGLAGEVGLDPAACGLGEAWIVRGVDDVLAGVPLADAQVDEAGRLRWAAALAAGEVGVYRVTRTRLADFDVDGDVDVGDLGALESCMRGPDADYAVGDTCRLGDADGDRDVDLADMAVIQRMFGGL